MIPFASDPEEIISSSKDGWRMNIATATGISFLLVFLIIMFIGSRELMNIQAIKNTAQQISKERLPDFVDTQKTLANIENLRRIAEIANISQDPQARRNARISAEALAMESIFDRNTPFHSTAQKVAANIRTMVQAKSELDRKYAEAEALRMRYQKQVISISRYTLDGNSVSFLLQLAHAVPALHIITRETLPDIFRQAKDLQQLLQDLPDSLGDIRPTGRQSIKDDVVEIEKSLRSFLLLSAGIADERLRIQRIWQNIDTDLRDMLDRVTLGTEVSMSEALQSITETSAQAQRTSLLLYCTICASFIAYFYVQHALIAKPIRWVSDKLLAIQRGELDTSRPAIHIQEMGRVADLLDHFSEHLTELYSRTDMLQEDAEAKRNLEEIMRAVFKVSLDGYLVWNPEHVIFVSPGAIGLLGLKSQEEFHSKWGRDKKLAAMARHVQRQLTSNTVWREEIRLSLNPATEVPCEVTHLQIAYGNEQAILSYIRDLREQKRHEHALLIAKEKAEIATQAKSEFLARMSHEIRTPMNGVIGLTKLALDSNPTPYLESLLRKIQASARILLGIINDILDFSKLEQGQFHLENRPFILSNVFTTVGDLLQPQAEQQHIEFNLVLPEGPIPALYLSGDELRLSQVLLNLCGNGIKFTHQGHVTLTVTVLQHTEESVTLTFSVRDTGIGISEEMQQKIFMPFIQADSSTTRRYGGTGLGLMISKLLVEQMGGKIRLASALNQGCDFSFDLTFPIVDHLPVEDAAEDAEGPVSFAGKTALVAEDNEINQEIITAFLEQMDFTVILAANGQEAVDLFKQQPVDCVFMDIQMPVMDGLTAAGLIKTCGVPGADTVPIIAMTAHALKEDIQKSRAAGMCAHLTKPIDHKVLVDCLKRILQ